MTADIQESCSYQNKVRDPNHSRDKFGGFDTAVLSPSQAQDASNGGATDRPIEQSNSWLFLVSNAAHSDTASNYSLDRKIVQTRSRNRKDVTYSGEFEFDGKRYLVNAKKSGLYKNTLKSMLSQYEVAKNKWGRVFVYRFDLHLDSYTSDNKVVTNFRKRLWKRLKNKYGFKDIGFCWVRERERAKAQHYHWVLFLDGNLIKHPKLLFQMIKEAWERQSFGHYHVPVVKSPFYFVDNPDTEIEAIYRSSYLAKARGKGYRNKQAKDFQCSRMKLQMQYEVKNG